jgi:SAM-dependent methyltransferase
MQKPSTHQTDYAALYDGHPEYEARRQSDSFERMWVDTVVRYFKLPYLLNLAGDWRPRTVLEIGCATGELIARFPVLDGGCRTGVDISECNIEIARQRFPQVSFVAGDFRHLNLEQADALILSDVLEHVPDDTAFLEDAGHLGRRVLINLPLECNWLNRGRPYGPQDASGHLRAYTLEQGLALIERAGLRIERWQRIWFHETLAESHSRALRRQYMGQAYAGGALGRELRRAAYVLARMARPVGRRLFPSNLFAVAERR